MIAARFQPGRLVCLLMLLCGLASGCAEVPSPASRADMPATAIAPSPATAPAADEAWAAIDQALERHGHPHDGVYTFAIPRDDLHVSIEGMAIPSAAGIESVFHFYRCPCGKMNVAGQFVVTDYESNDVVDVLRQNALFRVAAIAPLLQYETPRMALIRFQAEGDPTAMAKALRDAIRWTANERMAPDRPPAVAQ